MPVSDIRPKKHSVILDKPRFLCFDMNAFAEIEEKYGTVQDGLAALGSQQLKAVRFLLWAGLLHEDESLTERQVGAMFTMKDIANLTGPLMQAIQDALPKVDEEEAKNE